MFCYVQLEPATSALHVGLATRSKASTLTLFSNCKHYRATNSIFTDTLFHNTEYYKITCNISVFILCAYGMDVMFVICAAETSGLLHGEHVFISIDFAYMTKVKPEDRPCDIYKFLDGRLNTQMLIYIFERLLCIRYLICEAAKVLSPSFARYSMINT